MIKKKTFIENIREKRAFLYELRFERTVLFSSLELGLSFLIMSETDKD